VVYDELRRLAGSMMRNERSGHTLQPTALVHEAYLRLIGPAKVSWENRAHFFGAAALAMRRILIDRARHIQSTRVERNAAPISSAVLGAGAGAPSGAPPSGIDLERDADELVHLDGAMESLRRKDDRQHEVVMLRYFAGLTIDQTALAMGLSTGTVKNEWSYARAWLLREIDRRRTGEGAPEREGTGRER
jgi:RNA polymerase sigma factor (TIGR02999 family)